MLTLILLNVFVLMFLAGAKKTSYSPAEIKAADDEQYEALQK